MLEIPDVISFAKPSDEGFKPAIANEEEVKKAFGLALGQGKQAFEAALQACGDNTSVALYISQRWLNDPIVAASKDLYLKAVYNGEDLLDADQLAAKLLTMSAERDRGNNFYILEGKDRLAALKLYAEVRGYTGKAAIDMSTKNITFKQINVRLIEPIKKEDTSVLDNNEEQISNNKSGIKLKLVS